MRDTQIRDFLDRIKAGGLEAGRGPVIQFVDRFIGITGQEASKALGEEIERLDEKIRTAGQQLNNLLLFRGWLDHGRGYGWIE